MITVIEAAPHRQLITPETVRSAEGDTSTDEVLLPLISAASAAIESFLGRMLARERVRETFLPTPAQQRLPLARWPISEVVEVVEDGRFLASGDFDVDLAAGMLQRLAGGRAAAWMPCRTEVEYVAGYVLDGDNRDLPADIEDACCRLVAARRALAGRDQSLRSVEVGGVALQWSTPEVGHPAMPIDVLALLAPYRVPLIA